MSDPIEPGRAIGDHWGLLTIIGGAIVGIFGLFRAVVSALDGRISEQITIQLSNGIGKKVDDAVAARVAESMMNHTFDCPYKEKASEHHDRLIELENRLLRKGD